MTGVGVRRLAGSAELDGLVTLFLVLVLAEDFEFSFLAELPDEKSLTEILLPLVPLEEAGGWPLGTKLEVLGDLRIIAGIPRAKGGVGKC